VTIWVIVCLATLPFSALNFLLYSRGSGWTWLGVGVEFVGHSLIWTPLLFCVPLIADRDCSARQATRLSWARVRRDVARFFGCVVVFTLVLLLGVFACGVGIILTLPLVVAAQVLAYHELFEGFEVPQMTPIRAPASGAEGGDEDKDGGCADE
jgi:uncharacterized membrane protein